MRWSGEDGKDVLQLFHQSGRGWLTHEVYSVTSQWQAGISLLRPLPPPSPNSQKDRAYSRVYLPEACMSSKASSSVLL